MYSGGVGARSSSQMKGAESACGLDPFSSCAWQPPLQAWNRQMLGGAVHPGLRFFFVGVMKGQGTHRLKVLRGEE